MKNIDRCNGCMVCNIICPKKCINYSLVDGYYKANIDNEKCIECDLCDKVCSERNGIIKTDIKYACSAYLKDENILKTVSSGGLAYEISKEYLKLGYKVCACIYNYEENIAEHIIIDNMEDLEKTKGSKYIQSYTKTGFGKLLNGDKYVVIGSPCQIASIRNLIRLKKVEDNFVLIDFFCHGVPSYLIWDKYLKEQKNKYKMKDIKNIEFRNKKYGWHNFTMKLNNNYSDKNIDKDNFLWFFLTNTVLNNECYTCKFRADNSLADIRLGDLWGTKYEENKIGVSGALVFTNRGIEAVEKIKNTMEVKEEKIKDILEAQIKTDIPKSAIKNNILKQVKTEKTLNEIFDENIKRKR